MQLNRSLILAGLVAAVVLPAHAEDWKSLANEQGVKLEAQTLGNLARLRFTNTGKGAAQANWKVETALASKQIIENQGDLKLESGESTVVAVGPYRDTKGPQAIQDIHGKMTVTPAAK